MQIDITMKRLLSLMALCCLVFVACSNDENVDNDREPAVDKITLSKSVIEVGFELDIYSVNVTSPYSWDAPAKNDWIVLNTTNGIAGTKELQFITKRNDEKEVREGTIVIQNKDAGLYAELSVVQEAYTQAVGIKAVDLGLSVKWANCNVGSERPEEYGDYFAWGEVSPKDSYFKDNCSTSYVPMSDISGNPQYDAATANWGGAWRMPTEAEQDELRNNCTWKWTKLNGVNGYKVTGPNGNSIFLPAAGFRYGTSSLGVGSYGGYWSSTPNEDYDYGAGRLYFDSDGYYGHWNDRYGGQSVRPVIE